MDTIVDRIEEFYQENSVSKSLILCCNDEDSMRLADGLARLHHSVVCITEDDTTDDRCNYIYKLNAFTDNSCRMLIVPYVAWYNIQNQIESMVLPEQNLFIMVDIDEDTAKYVQRWLDDAFMRGFANNNAQNHVLVLESPTE